MTTTRILRSRLALATCGALGLALVTGCTAGTKASSSGGDGESRLGDLQVLTEEATSEVDSVKWNVFQGEPSTVDPFRSADYTPNMINSNMCETLLSQTNEFDIAPNLAESFENPDPLHWVYTLRDDVTFWDGTPMTAEDVAWSLEHNRTDPATFYNYLYSNVESVDVTGEHEVTVTLKRPDYLFNDELASFAGVVVQKKHYEANEDTYGSPATGVMCTGPYMYEKWTKGESITLARNDDYWNDELQPKVRTFEFTFLVDSAAITSALLSGEIDGTYFVPEAGIDQLRNSGRGTVTAGPAPLNLTFVYANSDGAAANPEVRKALQMAIDWKGIAESVYKDTAEPLKIQTPRYAFGAANDDLQEYVDTLPEPPSAKYEEAKKIVDALPASVRSEEISMVLPAVAETQQFALAVKDAATRIGLNFKLKVVPETGYSNYLYDPATRGDIDIFYTTFWSNIPNPLDWLSLTAVTGGLFNQYGYTGIDDLFAEAQGTKDPAKQAELILQMEEKLREDLLPMVPGLEIHNTVWMNNRITGAPAAFNFLYYPWAAHVGGTE
ncbi:ABC transporter substrate-binding protein [Nocardioides eburneiflavus]|uniref:ABC transporter substrate-binding protein n=1 Tax=Nocardioides eburneiflavus TaxID=2518372 RepID=A0A4Z1CKV1_9ACTN|nr:ABC transporter substrate-binding protein [Nocardioides eburneiflavus]TGN65753.1 ABC transporter substrate-binding protein [Nocardioides eburneiflavus]